MKFKVSRRKKAAKEIDKEFLERQYKKLEEKRKFKKAKLWSQKLRERRVTGEGFLRAETSL